MKFIMTYLRTFTHEFECATLQEADVRSKVWAKNFPPGDVTVLSVIQEGYRSPPEAAEPKLSKMELMVDGMRKQINTMLPKDPA
jgi:hypothetical protein